MKVKFSDILEASEHMGKLSRERLPVGQSISLARLIKRLNEEMTIFSQQREKLLIQYGELNEEEGTYLVEKDNAEAFREDYDELLKSEVETGTEKLKITLQKDSSIEALVLLGCEKFCEFEEG